MFPMLRPARSFALVGAVIAFAFIAVAPTASASAQTTLQVTGSTSGTLKIVTPPIVDPNFTQTTLEVHGTGSLHRGAQVISVTQNAVATKTMSNGNAFKITQCSGEHGTLTTADTTYTYALPHATCGLHAGTFTYNGTVRRNNGPQGTITIQRTVVETTVVNKRTQKLTNKWTYSESISITIP